MRSKKEKKYWIEKDVVMKRKKTFNLWKNLLLVMEFSFHRQTKCPRSQERLPDVGGPEQLGEGDGPSCPFSSTTPSSTLRISWHIFEMKCRVAKYWSVLKCSIESIQVESLCIKSWGPLIEIPTLQCLPGGSGPCEDPQTSLVSDRGLGLVGPTGLGVTVYVQTNNPSAKWRPVTGV